MDKRAQHTTDRDYVFVKFSIKPEIYLLPEISNTMVARFYGVTRQREGKIPEFKIKMVVGDGFEPSKA